jgi:hypothetical protein
VTAAAMSSDDLMLARILLGGFVDEDERGLPHERYLSESDETEARLALVRLLRSEAPLAPRLRVALAGLFHPDDEAVHLVTDDSTGKQYSISEPRDRNLVFRFRKKKRRAHHKRNTVIVQFMYDLVKAGKSIEEARGDAHDEFGLSDGAIKKIWDSYSELRKRGVFR